MKKKQKLTRIEDVLEIGIPVDPSLHELSGRVLFPEQRESLNRLFKIPGFAEGLKKAMRGK